MELIAIGGDLRYAHMVRQAYMTGVSAAALGLERANVSGVAEATWAEVARADVVVMPNPFLKGPILPLTDKTFDVDTLLGHLNAGTTLMLFGPGDVPDLVRVRHPIVMLAKDEPLTCAFARQTAEGAIHAAMQRAAYELYGCPVMIIGYGRIGKALHHMLNGYGAHVSVVARRDAARKESQALGATALDVMQMDALIGGQRMIFSTPPERVIDGALALRIRPDALLIDLSSPPYGVDLDAVLARGVTAWREPALPGRYCPESAGAAMFDAVCRVMKGESDYDQ